MVEINIDPFAFRLDSFGLLWSSIIGVVAMALALFLFIVEARRFHIKKINLLWLCLGLALAGRLVGRLVFLLEKLYFLNTIEPVIGLYARMPGVVLGTIAVIFIYAKLAKLPVMRLMDTGAPSLYLFLTVFRVGCIINGCCFGLPCELPWAVTYNNLDSAAPLGIPSHPTQVYQLISAAVVFTIVLILLKRPRIPGFPAFVGLFLYSVGDFFIRMFRADEPVVFGISFSQVIVLLLAISAATIIFHLKVTGRRLRFVA
jgi:phosphatidylglycerol:prolipoprotein diacylglycerol transferase